MWPVILIGGLIALGGVLLSSVKEEEKRECMVCGKEIKDDIPQDLCDECRLLNISDVEVFSANYLGDKYKPCNDVGVVSSLPHRDKFDAMVELKMRAKRMGCDIIHDVVWKCHKGCSGNYVYSIWRAEGVAAQRGNK